MQLFSSRPLLALTALCSLLLLAACGGAAPPQGWGSGLVSSDILYFGGPNAKLYALDVNSGAHKWDYAGEKDHPLVAIYNRPALDNGVLYFGAYNGSFYALDAASGTHKWDVSIGAPIISSPVVQNGVLYFGANDHALYALDPTTGARKIAPFMAEDRIWATPVVTKGVVYVGSLDHKFYALNASDLTKKWDYAAGGIVVSPALVAGSTVYFGSLGNLIALDSTSGALRWQKSVGAESWIWAPLSIVSGTLYVADLGGHVNALDPATGNQKWTFTAEGPILSGIEVVNGIAYFGAEDNKVYALDAATGQPKWPQPYTSKGKFLASPVVAGDSLFIPSQDRGLYALRLSDGSLKWAFDTSKDTIGVPQ